jgi:anti-sigma factor RsiW
MSTLRQSLRFRLDHRWVPGRMSAYLDGELRPRGRARVERHAGRCPQCRQVLHGLRTLVDLLRAAPAPREPASRELVAAVRARLPGSGG